MLLKIKNFIREHHTWTVPAILSLILFAPVLIWLQYDSSLPGSETARHLYNSIQYGRLWYNYLSGTENIVGLATWYTFFPPFFYQAAVLFYVFFGTAQAVAIASNLIWIFILIFSLYNSARLVWNKKTACLAVLALFAMPLMINAVRDFQIYLPLAAWVMLTFYLLQKYRQSFGFKNALALGLTLGLGMLISWIYLIYALPLLILFFWEKIKSSSKQLKKLTLLGIFSLSLSFIVCGFWYISNRFTLHRDLAAAYLNNGSSTSFLKYFAALGSGYLLLPILLIFIAAVVFSLQQNNFRKNNWRILLLSAVFFVIFAFLPGFDSRNLLPLAPMLAILIGSLVNLKPSLAWQYGFGSFLILMLLLNTLTQSFGLRNSSLGFGQSLPILKGSDYGLGAPKAALCPIRPIIESIPAYSNARLVGVDSEQFNSWAIAYYLDKSGRIWGGNGSDTSTADYWILRLDSSLESKMSLFDYQDQGFVRGNFNCHDRSLVIVLKKQDIIFNPKY